MKKNEIIEKTLKDMGLPPLKNEPPSGQETDEEIVVAELERRLPDTEIKTCDDFKHLNVECCEVCHMYCAHEEMQFIDLPDGTKAWVCDSVERAIYPERHDDRDAERMLKEIFGKKDVDDSSSEKR